jgi:hypothetical protein
LETEDSSVQRRNSVSKAGKGFEIFSCDFGTAMNKK